MKRNRDAAVAEAVPAASPSDPAPPRGWDLGNLDALAADAVPITRLAITERAAELLDGWLADFRKLPATPLQHSPQSAMMLVQARGRPADVGQ